MDKSLYLKEEKLYQAFKMLDLDKSGKISKDELKSVLGKELNIKNKDDSYWDSMIKEVDKNGDGEVNLKK
jgi:calcium-dependent protein kinase